jgi:hypothetical protein
MVPITDEETGKVSSAYLTQDKNNEGELDEDSFELTFRQVKLPEYSKPIGILHEVVSEKTQLDVMIHTRQVQKQVEEGKRTDGRTQKVDCADWLIGFLKSFGNVHEYSAIKSFATAQGYSESTLKRARVTAGVVTKRLKEVPPRTIWFLESHITEDEAVEAFEARVSAPTNLPISFS